MRIHEKPVSLCDRKTQHHNVRGDEQAELDSNIAAGLSPNSTKLSITCTRWSNYVKPKWHFQTS